MRITDRISTLINNPEINKSPNDVRWFSGWDRKLHTAQYRFGTGEARALVRAIRQQPIGTQRALVRELDRRSTQGHFVGSMSFISGPAAAVMNKLAADLGLSNHFDVDARRATTPRG